MRIYASISSETKSIHKISSRNGTISIHIKIYLRLILDDHHPKKYFYKWNMTFLFGNALGRIKCSYFTHANILSNLKNIKWLKKVCACSVNDHDLQNFELFFLWQNNCYFFLLACGKVLSNWKNWWTFFSEILTQQS